METIDDRIIDCHVHVFPPEFVHDRADLLEKDPWFASLYSSPTATMATVDDVVADMDRDGVDQAVVFGFAFHDQGLCRLMNDYVIEAVARFPERVAGLCCVSPEVSGAVAEVERCLDAGLKGCGELAPDGQCFAPAWIGSTGRSPGVVPAGGPVGRSGVAEVAACLVERDLPLIMHSNEPVGHEYPGKGCFTPEACYAFAAAHPGLKIVFAHMGGGLFLYELMPEVRAVLERAYYDTSAVPYLYDPRVYQVAVSCVGAGKILFGSDYPLLPLPRYREGIDTLDAASRVAVLGANAQELFGL
jgi:hypothetical protein